MPPSRPATVADWLAQPADARIELIDGELHKQVRAIAPETMAALVGYAWPGNVRELHNVLERGAALCQGEVIGADDLPGHVRERKPGDFLAAAVARAPALIATSRRRRWLSLIHI